MLADLEFAKSAGELQPFRDNFKPAIAPMPVVLPVVSNLMSPSTVSPSSMSPSLGLPTPKRRRADHPDVANLCDHCTAKCCHYFALPIDEPTERRDLDFMRWYLLHDRASVFVDDDVWYLLVHTTCKHLRDDYRCGIYETRPQICRDYTTDKCEFEDDWCYEKYFETPEQVYEYSEAVYGPNDSGNIRSRKPTGLPMV